MKKSLLLTVLALSTGVAMAEEKTEKLNIATAAFWGVEAPETGKGADLTTADSKTHSVTTGDVTLLLNQGTATTATRLWNASGTLQLRAYTGSTMTFTANDQEITKIEFEVSGSASSYCNFTTDVETFATPTWTGKATSVTFTTAATTRLISVSVTYDAKGGNGGATGEKESYTAISWDGSVYTISDEFKAAVVDPEKGGIANAVDGASVVKFGTKSIEAEAVGGTTAKTVDATSVLEWNEIKWDWKNQGDIKFGYIVGTGNPVFGYEIEQVYTEGVATGTYRQCFNKQNPEYDPAKANEAKVNGTTYDVPQYNGTYFYTADCGATPAQGLYYKFKAKAAGLLKMYIWSNKNNRNTFLVDAQTTKPVAYRAEGYINGQNYNVDNGDPEELNGQKKWLSSDEIKAIHVARFGEGEADASPYVIGAGNQNYWGCVVYEIAEGQTLLLFQDSSQVGFQGFEFIPGGKDDGGSLNGIESVKAVKSNNLVFDLCGNRVSKMQSGRIYIQNGKKVIIR